MYAEVIGDPVAHSKSPLIHKFWLEKLGLEGDYRAVRVDHDGLAEYLRERRRDPDWRGCNVTIPHKRSVIPLLDEIREEGIGAVNCIVPREQELIGFNTDAIGVTRILLDNVPPDMVIEQPVCLIGAGGAARAALAALRGSPFKRVNLLVRQRARGDELLRAFGAAGEVYTMEQAAAAISGAIGLVNATPLGMVGAPPLPETVLDGVSALHPDAFVFDMVYAPLWTDLLDRASAAGLEVIDGFEMLVGQAEVSFGLFYGVPSPGPLPELRELIAR